MIYKTIPYINLCTSFTKNVLINYARCLNIVRYLDRMILFLYYACIDFQY